MLKKTRNFFLRKFSTTTQCLKITKSRIQHCERSVLRLHFEWTKNAKKTVLPDRSLSVGQKLVKNAEIQMRHFWCFSNIVNAQGSACSAFNARK